MPISPPGFTSGKLYIRTNKREWDIATEYPTPNEAQRRRYYQNLKYGDFQVRPQPKYEWVYLALYGLLHLISLVR